MAAKFKVDCENSILANSENCPESQSKQKVETSAATKFLFVNINTIGCSLSYIQLVAFRNNVQVKRVQKPKLFKLSESNHPGQVKRNKSFPLNRGKSAVPCVKQTAVYFLLVKMFNAPSNFSR